MAEASPNRLVVFTAVLTDLVVSVETLPAPGRDIVGRGFREVVAGGFNVLAAAARQGMATSYARILGSDPRAQRTRQALVNEGVELLLPDRREGTSGVCVVMVDASGERTMVTVEGVEAELAESDLAQIVLGPKDAVYLSGYDLVSPHGSALCGWLEANDPATLIFDPGPLIHDLDQTLLSGVLDMTTWLSMNAGEAEEMTGEADPRKAAAAALSRGMRLRGVVTRTGSEGCQLALRNQEVTAVPAFPAQVVDTTGAGDAHVGAFAAALARGLSPRCGCRWANAAASVVVGRWGAATAPTLATLEPILSGRGLDQPRSDPRA